MVKHENNQTSNIIQNVFMNKHNSAHRHTYTNTHPYTYVTTINVSKKRGHNFKEAQKGYKGRFVGKQRGKMI